MRRWSAISLGLLLGLCASGAVQAQPADTIRLTVEQLFDRGTSCNLQLQADLLKERMAEERRKDARKQAYPDVEVELAGGVIGQPVVFLHGLTDPTYPETPDWSQDYGIVFRQPIYKSGKITLGIQKAELERQIAVLETAEDDASVKLGLLQQYLNLFCLYKQQELLSYKIRESERRLIDIRQMKREGLITNNDVLRSELQLTDDQLALTEVNDGILLVSQQLAILLDWTKRRSSVPTNSFSTMWCRRWRTTNGMCRPPMLPIPPCRCSANGSNFRATTSGMSARTICLRSIWRVATPLPDRLRARWWTCTTMRGGSV